MVYPDAITDKEIHRITGYHSRDYFRIWAAIFYNDHIDTFGEMESALTWFEEFVIFHELLYGKSISRWEDVEHKYKIDKRYLMQVFNSKLRRLLVVRQS